MGLEFCGGILALRRSLHRLIREPVRWICERDGCPSQRQRPSTISASQEVIIQSLALGVDGEIRAHLFVSSHLRSGCFPIRGRKRSGCRDFAIISFVRRSCSAGNWGFSPPDERVQMIFACGLFLAQRPRTALMPGRRIIVQLRRSTIERNDFAL